MNQIEICKTCIKRKSDFQKGLVCSLTNKKPNFELTCPNFEKDSNVKAFKGLELRPNKKRANYAMVLILIILVMEFVSFISYGFQLFLLQNLAEGIQVTHEQANANDLRVLIIQLLIFLLHIISAITFIRWFRRAYYNLHQKIKVLSFSDGWTAGAWFVPVISLYRPYQIMKELFQDTKVLLTNKGINVSSSFNTKILVWWWTLWLVNNIAGNIIYQLSTNKESVDELITYTIASMVMNIIGIPLALITIKMIQDYSEIEPLLYDTQDQEQMVNEKSEIVKE